MKDTLIDLPYWIVRQKKGYFPGMYVDRKDSTNVDTTSYQYSNSVPKLESCVGV